MNITLISLIIILMGLVLYFYNKVKVAHNNIDKKTSLLESQKEDFKELNIKLTKSQMKEEELGKIKNQFLANISHEIRTPLNSISGYAQLLAKNLKTESNNYHINQVIQATDNLKIIINDLLDFSKIEAGKMILEHIDFNPIKIITQAISTLKLQAEEKNITLEIHIDPLIPILINGDPYRLSQVLINLISNAIKFSNDNQAVTIEAKCKSSNKICTMSFAITDHGLGIPQNKLKTIFESFTQTHSDTARLFRGSGLGLSIVKRLIELQNGNIKVESKLKEGSVFSFAIEYRTVDKSNKIDNQKNQKDMGKTIYILLVEDNLMNQELAKDTILSWTGSFKIDIAENGKEALLAIQDNDYNVILMDIQMPVMDGHEATQYIRSSLAEPKCNIPIIGMTAHAMSSEKELALKNGMTDYITKPFNPDDLQQKIINLAT